MTFERIAKELDTPWDGSWAKILNRDVGPRLKGIHFEEHVEMFRIKNYDMYGNETETESLVPGAPLVKIVIEANPDYFKNELKEGGLDTRTFLARIEGWIVQEWGYQLFKPAPESIKEEETE